MRRRSAEWPDEKREIRVNSLKDNPTGAEKTHRRLLPVNPSRQCYMIGLQPQELEWVRLLVKLLRHKDPLPPELARQALHYVDQIAEAGGDAARAMRPAARQQQA